MRSSRGTATMTANCHEGDSPSAMLISPVKLGWGPASRRNNWSSSPSFQSGLQASRGVTLNPDMGIVGKVIAGGKPKERQRDQLRGSWERGSAHDHGPTIPKTCAPRRAAALRGGCHPENAVFPRAPRRVMRRRGPGVAIRIPGRWPGRISGLGGRLRWAGAGPWLAGRRG